MIKVVHKDDEKSTRLATQISSRLPQSNTNQQLIVCVGGDGTILRAIHDHINELENTIFFGVKAGHLGFFADYTEESIDALIDVLSSHEYSVSRYNLLEAHITTTTQTIPYVCMNEFQILSGSRTIKLDVEFDGELFESFHGNGMVFSTPAGSTGLNKSLGGAIIDPRFEAVQLTEVAPINSNAYRTIGSPMVLSVERLIVVKAAAPTKIDFSYDHEVQTVEEFVQLEIIKSSRKVQIAQIDDVSFFERIQKAFL
jgi:NAD+ kinase